ncbi:RT0821/Lpp0805 family surface protein [Sulfuriflexus sp.]|uniref:RT0821/Lpp0805 family surface protein n=1 Tax=Sulfuriflexus sp. TaxID=2015443 RepID=UPI00391FC4D9
MRHKLFAVLMPVIVSVFLVGCQSTPSKEGSGQVVGGLLGGVLGSQIGKGKGRTAAIIAGTLAGAYFGGKVGKSMDETDRQKAYDSLEYNQTNQPASWENPDSGNAYTVTPTRTYSSDSRPCRDYTTEVVIDGRRETATGTACRENGTWRVIN